jgi:hypothetical protein
MRLDEFVATRLVETRVHGMGLTDALGAPPLPMPQTTTMAAEVLDEVPAGGPSPASRSWADNQRCRLGRCGGRDRVGGGLPDGGSQDSHAQGDHPQAP